MNARTNLVQRSSEERDSEDTGEEASKLSEEEAVGISGKKRRL